MYLNDIHYTRYGIPFCHCEEQSDEAISSTYTRMFYLKTVNCKLITIFITLTLPLPSKGEDRERCKNILFLI